MRILVLGGSGMVGRNFMEHPGSVVFEIIAPSRKELDLFNYPAVESFVRSCGPDLILNAAGRVGGIQANMREPLAYFLENLDLGRNIIWAGRQAGVKKLLNLGSSCMYPRNAANPLREEMVLTGELEPTNEGYALAKIAAARFCRYINAEDSSFEYKTLIPCNLYGRWDDFDLHRAHLVPSIIHKVHRAKMEGQGEVVIWGDGRARREFMYAGDLADCLIHALHNFAELPEMMNVGPGRDSTIDEYYAAAAGVIGYRGDFVHDLSRPAGMRQKLVDITRLTNFGWQAKTDLQSGIEKTYEFYLSRGSALT